MTVRELYVIGVGLALAGIFVTGRQLRGLNKARKTILLSAHKLLSVCVAALLAVTAYRVSRAAQLSIEDLVSVVAAGCLWVATAASGGVAAQEGPARAVRILHRITSVLTALATAAATYFLLFQS